VPDPVGAQAVERAANRFRAIGLARVRHRSEPAISGDLECPLVRRGRIQRLGAAKSDADHAAVAVSDGVPGSQLGDLQ
jgi:hypothetical protein